MFFVASACSIPLVSMISALSFMGPLQVSFHWQDMLALCLTFLGLLLYHANREQQADGMDSPESMSAAFDESEELEPPEHPYSPYSHSPYSPYHDIVAPERYEDRYADLLLPPDR